MTICQSDGCSCDDLPRRPDTPLHPLHLRRSQVTAAPPCAPPCPVAATARLPLTGTAAPPNTVRIERVSATHSLAYAATADLRLDSRVTGSPVSYAWGVTVVRTFQRYGPFVAPAGFDQPSLVVPAGVVTETVLVTLTVVFGSGRTVSAELLVPVSQPPAGRLLVGWEGLGARSSGDALQLRAVGWRGDAGAALTYRFRYFDSDVAGGGRVSVLPVDTVDPSAAFLQTTAPYFRVTEGTREVCSDAALCFVN